MDAREREMALLRGEKNGTIKRASSRMDKKTWTLEDIINIKNETDISETKKKTKTMNKLREYLENKYQSDDFTC